MGTRALLVVIPLFATPFLIVFAHAFLGIDLYQWQDHLLRFTLGSAGVAVILVFILQRFPNKDLKQSLEFIRELRE